MGTSASSVQSFRSRHAIYRRREERTPHIVGSHSVFEGALDHGERDGWGLWLDPSVAEDPIWKERWSGVDSVVVKVSADAIVLEPYGNEDRKSEVGERDSARSTGAEQREEDTDDKAPTRERGRVKRFDKEKSYGFLVRPGGKEIFVHHSEVEPEQQGALEAGEEVDYEPGGGKHGELARKVRSVRPAETASSIR